MVSPELLSRDNLDTNMSPGCLSIFVALVAVFSGVLIYINVRCICPKTTPEDSLVIPVLSYVYHVISSVGEKLGISPRYRTAFT